jgi:hypothetical protein
MTTVPDTGRRARQTLDSQPVDPVASLLAFPGGATLPNRTGFRAMRLACLAP